MDANDLDHADMGGGVLNQVTHVQVSAEGNGKRAKDGDRRGNLERRPQEIRPLPLYHEARMRFSRRRAHKSRSGSPRIAK